MRIAALTDHRMGDSIDVLKGISPLVLQHELEAAYRADTLDGGRFKGSDETSRNLEELGGKLGDDIVRRMPRTFLAALLDWFEWRKDDAGVRRASTCQRESHDGEGSKDVVILTDDIGGTIRQLRGVSQRRPRRRLHKVDEVVLIFRGHEGCRHMVVHVDRSAQTRNEEQKHNRPELNHVGDDIGVSGDDLLKSSFKESKQATVRTLRPKQDGSERRREREGVERRDGDRERDGQGELFVEDARRSRKEADRYKYGDQHK